MDGTLIKKNLHTDDGIYHQYAPGGNIPCVYIETAKGLPVRKFTGVETIPTYVIDEDINYSLIGSDVDVISAAFSLVRINEKHNPLFPA